MGGGLCEDDLQCRPDMRLQEMAAMGRAVALAEHHVRMKLRLAVLQRDVAGQIENLDLLIDGDLLIILIGP